MKLFHGTTKDIDVLLPSSVDFGNRFTKPGWSIFAWNNYDQAVKWAVWMFCLDVINEMKPKFKKDTFGYAFINDSIGLVLSTEFTDKLVAHINKLHMMDQVVYVYCFKAPFYKVHLGNSSLSSEYTVRESVSKFRKHRIRVNEHILRSNIIVADGTQETMVTFTMLPEIEVPRFGRMVSPLIWNREYNDLYETYNEINNAVREGKLNIGDDFTSYLREAGIK